MISIHALREEGDDMAPTITRVRDTFLSTPSARRATRSRRRPRTFLFIFLSTPSARRATRQPLQAGRLPDISIHALREEGDTITTPQL